MFKTWLNRPDRHVYRDRYMPVLCTLDDLKADMGASVDTSDDDLKGFIVSASSMLTAYCQRTFVPYTGTRVMTWQSPYRLNLMEDAVSLTSVTDDDGVVASSEYVLTSRHNEKRELTMIDSNTLARGDVTLVGTWGYHDSPDDMWASDTTTITANISDTTSTQFTVNAVTDLKVYQYIRINAEVMLITDIDTGSKTLTVLRGQRGSTASTHTNADGVDTFKLVSVIDRACRELANYLYENSSTVTSTYVTDNDDVNIGSGLPQSVRTAIELYRV